VAEGAAGGIDAGIGALNSLAARYRFAKLKALLRTAATRTVDALWHAIGHALDAFSPTECAHYLAHAGYVPSNRNLL